MLLLRCLHFYVDFRQNSETVSIPVNASSKTQFINLDKPENEVQLQINENKIRNKTISFQSICLKKKDGLFAENLKTGYNCFSDLYFRGEVGTSRRKGTKCYRPIMNRRGKKENWKLTKKECSKARIGPAMAIQILFTK